MTTANSSVGGVSLNLDYDLGTMCQFCSWIVFSLFKCTNSQSSPHFQSLLQSVLNATRLPKSTILLGIHYVSVKIDEDENTDTVVHTESQIFETLIIALMLANKYNDDNTFKNKSWSQATGLPLDKINHMERVWLLECRWNLHDHQQYPLVESCWSTWLLKLDSSASSRSNSTASMLSSSDPISNSMTSVGSNAGDYVLSAPASACYNPGYYVGPPQMQPPQMQPQFSYQPRVPSQLPPPPLPMHQMHALPPQMHQMPPPMAIPMYPMPQPQLQQQQPQPQPQQQQQQHYQQQQMLPVPKYGYYNYAAVY